MAITEHRGRKRIMGLKYIIISLLLNGEVRSVFEVTEFPDPFTWKTAIQHCKKSRINSTLAIPTVDLTNMTVIDKIDLKGEPWVGYFQSYEHFLFIVCVPLGEIKSYKFAQFSIGRLLNRPGMCYSLCGLRGYIGLQDGICYCIAATMNFLVADTVPFNSSCNKPLHCGNGMLCGDTGSSIISVYKKVSYSSNDFNGEDSGCMIVTKDEAYVMSAVNCTSKYGHLCEVRTGQTLNLTESTKKEQWVYTVKDCANAGKRPTAFIEDRKNFIFPNYSGSWWTTVVRDFIIRNCSESCTIIGTHSYGGFLKNAGGVIQLDFVHARINSTKMSVVCTSGENMENSTSEKKVTSPEMTSTDPAKTICTRTTSKATSTSFVSDQTSNEQGNRTKEPTKTTSGGPSTSLISVLTIGLAGLSLTAVVAIIVVCRKRRKEKATIHMEASNQKTTEAVVPSTTESHQTYYKHEKETLNQLEENDQGRVSSEYDTLKEFNAPFPSSTGNLYDRANFNVGNSTYEATFSTNNPRQAVQSNSYDHVRLKKTNDGKCDHVDLQDERNAAHEIDTYEQANSLPLDNIYYDTIQEKFKLHQQLEENVYNTANFHPTK